MVIDFTYQGSNISVENSVQKYISARINKASNVYSIKCDSSKATSYKYYYMDAKVGESRIICTGWMYFKPNVYGGLCNIFWPYKVSNEEEMAPNGTAYKRCSSHSRHKLLCKLCRTFPLPAMEARFTGFFWHACHADPMDSWRCCSQKWVMSRPIQVRQP